MIIIEHTNQGGYLDIWYVLFQQTNRRSAITIIIVHS